MIGGTTVLVVWPVSAVAASLEVQICVVCLDKLVDRLLGSISKHTSIFHTPLSQCISLSVCLSLTLPFSMHF